MTDSNHPFYSTVPSGEGVEHLTKIRDQFAALAGELNRLLEPNRELSAALTRLEEAAMWASKAISRAYEASPNTDG